MTATELIKVLANGIRECGKDYDVYFDTEAARFDTHLVKIESACFEDQATVNEDMVILYCDKLSYIHDKVSK